MSVNGRFNPAVYEYLYPFRDREDSRVSVEFISKGGRKYMTTFSSVEDMIEEKPHRDPAYDKPKDGCAAK